MRSVRRLATWYHKGLHLGCQFEGGSYWSWSWYDTLAESSSYMIANRKGMIEIVNDWPGWAEVWTAHVASCAFSPVEFCSWAKTYLFQIQMMTVSRWKSFRILPERLSTSMWQTSLVWRRTKFWTLWWIRTWLGRTSTIRNNCVLRTYRWVRPFIILLPIVCFL